MVDGKHMMNERLVQVEASQHRNMQAVPIRPGNQLVMQDDSLQLVQRLPSSNGLVVSGQDQL